MALFSPSKSVFPQNLVCQVLKAFLRNISDCWSSLSVWQDTYLEKLNFVSTVGQIKKNNLFRITAFYEKPRFAFKTKHANKDSSR